MEAGARRAGRRTGPAGASERAERHEGAQTAL